MAGHISLRIDFEGGLRVGPGKIRLLELIEETGSISAAGRAMAMSYRRAWLLVESMNAGFRTPVVDTRAGGRRGGGACLTRFGSELVGRYRRIERAAAGAACEEVAAMAAALTPGAGRLLPGRRPVAQRDAQGRRAADDLVKPPAAETCPD